MHQARLIRTVAFRASHHYWRREWSEEENRRVFGPQTRPHAHDWRVEAHVVGPVDESTGWAADLAALDAELAGVTAGWDGGDLNALVPPISSGALMPSTENMARWIFEQLQGRIPGPAVLVEVRVFESPDLGAVYPV